MMKKLIAIVLCCLMLTACVPGTSAPTELPTQPEGTEENYDVMLPIATAPDGLAYSEETEVQESVQPTQTEPLPTETQSVHEIWAPWLIFVYRGNENADGLIAQEVEVTQLTPEAVMAELIKAGVVPADTVVNSLEKDGTQLNIDFNEAFLNHLYTMGTSGEMILVSSVVNTFLGAFEAESVIFTVNGEIVESGHVIYDFPLTYSDNVVYERLDIFVD